MTAQITAPTIAAARPVNAASVRLDVTAAGGVAATGLLFSDMAVPPLKEILSDVGRAGGAREKCSVMRPVMVLGRVYTPPGRAWHWLKPRAGDCWSACGRFWGQAPALPPAAASSRASINASAARTACWE